MIRHRTALIEHVGAILAVPRDAIRSNVRQLPLAQAVLREAADRRRILRAVDKVEQIAPRRQMRLVLQQEQRQEALRSCAGSNRGRRDVELVAVAHAVLVVHSRERHRTHVRQPGRAEHRGGSTDGIEPAVDEEPVVLQDEDEPRAHSANERSAHGVSEAMVRVERNQSHLARAHVAGVDTPRQPTQKLLVRVRVLSSEASPLKLAAAAVFEH
eukprot:779717-Prymnesium_polylepis.1